MFCHKIFACDDIIIFRCSILFSYGRALQHSALRIWKGDDNNMNDARDKLLERSRSNSFAVLGIESL